MSSQLSFDYLSKKLDALIHRDSQTKIAVAVSGGADSLCLTLMAHEWGCINHVPIVALTVDHGLRQESSDEARQVHVWLSDKQIEHHILIWEGAKPKTRIEEKAREARYQLLLDWCRTHHITHLLLAHQLEDQVETFFLRLSHSSGIDGLTAMNPITCREGILLIRPFLDISRQEIRTYLTKHYQQKWVEDPSNQDTVYERVRLRKLLPLLSDVGLTPRAISLSIKRLRRVRYYLETMSQFFLERKVHWSDGGYAYILYHDWEALDAEIAIRVLSAVLGMISGEGNPRMEQIENICEQGIKSQTICGCELVPSKKGFFICREKHKMEHEKQLPAHQLIQWDRFLVYVNKQVKIAPLKEAIKIPNLPAKVRRTLPAFYEGEELLWVPSLDYRGKKDDINGKIELRTLKWKKK